MPSSTFRPEANLLYSYNRLLFSPFVAVQNVCRRNKGDKGAKERAPPVCPYEALACFFPVIAVAAACGAVEMVASFGRTVATAPHPSLPACPHMP